MAWPTTPIDTCLWVQVCHSVTTLAYWLVHSQLCAWECFALLGWPQLPRALRFSLGNICSFAPARQALIGHRCFSPSLYSNFTFLSEVEQFSFTPITYRMGQLLWPSRPFHTLPFLVMWLLCITAKGCVDHITLALIVPSDCPVQTSVRI